ncbi:MAG: hypothetical protein Q7J82_00885 [Coriobacteriia bacterium]|nr:hypothetical protein [Coriobacteriia bacterium]
MSEGRFDSETLLPVVTSLQAKGLLNEPRLAQPPNLRAMFTVSNDASLLAVTRPPKTGRRKARKRDVEEAVHRRKRLATAISQQDAYRLIERTADFIPESSSHDAEERQKQIEDDRAWLAGHGF